MTVRFKPLLISLAIPLGVGALAALLTAGSMADYQALNQPPFAPPGWVFPVVWTILYLLMGFASYLVYTSDADALTQRRALRAYAAQLAVNFLWPLVFFRWQMYLAAFFVLLVLWLLIVITIRRFNAARELAGTLLIPYLLWVTYAGYLNYGVYFLN